MYDVASAQRCYALHVCAGFPEAWQMSENGCLGFRTPPEFLPSALDQFGPWVPNPYLTASGEQSATGGSRVCRCNMPVRAVHAWTVTRRGVGDV